MDIRTSPDPPTLEASVLLAQSVAFLQAYFGRSLSRLGVKDVRVAADGARALELLNSGSFNLLLLDLDLPVVSGLELLEALREDHSHDDLAVVVTTNRCNTKTVKRALELGVSDFLAKPYSQSVVDERLRDALRGSSVEVQECPRLLVAHRDGLFHDAVVRGFGSDAWVTSAQSLGVLLTRASRCEADAFVFEPQMFGARLEFFLRSINRQRETPPPVISVGPLVGRQRPENYAGAIRDERDPAVLKRSITKLLEGAGAASPAGMPSREAFVSIIQQAFGMLAGIDVHPAHGESVPPGAGVVAIDLIADGRPVWTLELQATPETALTLTADMMGAARDAVASNHTLRGLGEIARIVARRIRQIALESETVLEVGNPRESISSEALASRAVVFAGVDIAPFSAALGLHDPATAAAGPKPIYLLLYRGDQQLLSSAPDAMMDSYRGWLAELNDAGAIVAGSGLEQKPAQVIGLRDLTAEDSRSAPTCSTAVLGCWMIEAHSDDQAADWARKLPFKEGAIEIRRMEPQHMQPYD